MTWRHYVAAERYDKFDIFRMMNAQQHRHARSSAR